MNPLIDLYLKCLKKIKVIHSLPGRLRVNIYGIREFPDLAKEYAPVLEKTVRNLSGVTSAELGTATGNLLINYDPAKTSEAELLLWLNSAWQKFSDFMQGMNENNVQDERSIAEAMERFLAKL